VKTETCPYNRDLSGPAQQPCLPDSGASSPYELDIEAVALGQIDGFAFEKLKDLGIKPAHPCSDAVFLRRAYLDVIGSMPTAQEAVLFLANRTVDKRAALVDALLERDEFADYWALKWSDILRVKSEFPINLWPMAAQAYHRWIRTCIAQNWPYDKSARALLTASGSNFRDPEVYLSGDARQGVMSSGYETLYG